MSENYNIAMRIKEEVSKAVIGKDAVIEKVLMAIFAGGHILIDDIPGVGKTTLAMAISKAMNLSYNRVQFTPDVMPSDITGYNIYNSVSGAFEYRPGACMCNLLLADEINRTSSKTQSALLEVMEENCVTVDTQRFEVPMPFVVIATQNPVGSVGTSKLPESQLDRFAIRLSIGYPDVDNEVMILKNMGNTRGYELVEAVADIQTLLSIREEVAACFVHDDILKYIATIGKVSRENANLGLGLSPRGALNLMNLSRANAFMRGRNYVIPNDVKEVFPYVAGHRLILRDKTKNEHEMLMTVMNEILSAVKVPNIG